MPSAVVSGSRQRFAERRRRRRWRSARPLLALVVAGGLGGIALWVLWFTGLFGVRRVDVVGSDGLPAGAVGDVAGVRQGAPLARVDTGAVRRRVEALPGVESVHVLRSWPSTLRIVVTERTAVAFAERGSENWLVDRHGVLFQRVVAPPPGMPMLRSGTGGSGDPVTGAELAVVRALPAGLRTEVGSVSAESPEAVRLTLRDGRKVLWGAADRGGEKARVLAALLHQPGAFYDVSTPSVVVVR